MVRRVLELLGIASMAVFMASCGTSNKLMSISVTPGAASATTGAAGATGSSAINLEGIGSFQALTVTAYYSNTKTQDVSVRSTYQLGASEDINAPLSAATVNSSGVVKAVNGACTWVAEPTDSPTNSKFGYGTSPYIVTITYEGFTTKAFVSVNSLAGCYDPSNPAPNGFPGD